MGSGTRQSNRVDAIEELPPGPELSRLLETFDRSRLNGHELVVLLQARARLMARIQADFYADIVELAHTPPCRPDDSPERLQVLDEYAADEIRAALTWTRRAAEYGLDVGWRMVERIPAVWEALHAGVIDLPKAKIIVDRTLHLDEATAREVATEILEVAAELTTGQLKARLDRMCNDADPDDTKDRYEKGVADRRVVAERQPDGTGDLMGLGLPADRVAAIMDRLTAIAERRKTRHEARSIDQLRSDIFMELLEGGSRREPRRRPTVDIHVDLPTLLGLNDRAGEIPGWGPVIADIARQAVHQQPDGEWRVVVTDPDNGAVLWNGTTRRRPTATQRRYVEARQPTCVFPGCRFPAQRSDFDHTVEVARGGKTLVGSLEPACRHDHQLRHQGGWTIEQPQPGTYQWTSPRSHTYTTGSSPP
ncbi:HNH endonuclease signature motif containing protein [soil metagenome]